MSELLSRIEKICANCNERFIPTVHKTHQKYCMKCKVIADNNRSRKNYLKNKYRHSSIRLTQNNASFIRKNGISISKFVNKKIEEMRKKQIETV